MNGIRFIPINLMQINNPFIPTKKYHTSIYTISPIKKLPRAQIIPFYFLYKNL
jgi:hypothetical protein